MFAPGLTALGPLVLLLPPALPDAGVADAAAPAAAPPVMLPAFRESPGLVGGRLAALPAGLALCPEACPLACAAP